MRRRNQGGDRAAGGAEAAGTETEATVVLLTDFLAQRRVGQQLSPNHPSLRGARRRAALPAQPLAAPALPSQAQPGHDDVRVDEPTTGTAPGRLDAPTALAPTSEVPTPELDSSQVPTLQVPTSRVPIPEPSVAAADRTPTEAELPSRPRATEVTTDRDAGHAALSYELRYEDPEAASAVTPEIAAEFAPEVAPVAAPETRPAPVADVEIPETARWRASNGPRFFTGALLAMACLGVAVLAVRFEAGRTFDDFVSLAIGGGIAVGLWAILIVSAPQVVTLRGSVLTLHHRGGYERFDLADGLQPVDVVGGPRSSQWALLLHRPDCSSAVLRRRDVDAAQLDPIVRHFRDIAEHRNAEREARFSR